MKTVRLIEDIKELEDSVDPEISPEAFEMFDANGFVFEVFENDHDFFYTSDISRTL